MPQTPRPLAKLKTLYTDEHFIVVDKPSGLLCVPGLSDPDNLFDRVKIDYPNARTVHRLDMATSGLVIFALHYEAQKALSKLFEHRQISKTYRARIFGKLDSNFGEIHSPLICDWPNRPKQKIDWLNGKQATTHFRKYHYQAEQHYSEVELTPHTGRTHQLRVHMLQIQHPILGDKLYAHTAAIEAATRMCLHAEKLQFKHPFTHKTLVIECAAIFD